MVQLDKKENEEVLLDTVQYLEKRGFENIQADVEGYESPKSYTKVGSDISITPDLVAEREGVKHYFEVSLKSAEPNLLKSKWRFLDVLTRMKNHRFKIVTRRGHYKFTDDMLRDLNLDKDPIKI
ncbi:hypothetical protein KXJ69_04155 [Aureisphaera sp. CAU 1614]|uniref:Uncharacterized protein n=1 Tax=Halomarinibacterium sedimenti TaxID=2857106 RepID=A0A9X1FMN4_9FLAO|nr:hypothetical protein [Halomarinibacterium sedimenti]MAL60558.1 hypothetical protein [Flavobacteriaceae bacterium]MBW2937284.1 hypothetical protein [Halomarinibacterium sedimenti]HAT66185.1 hypothetical protein [Flavobacteriaceae bacterium]|tara:strand:- start:232 stop:603 length:372 start_codon:yes stop_codon:yes gene_type:complete